MRSMRFSIAMCVALIGAASAFAPVAAQRSRRQAEPTPQTAASRAACGSGLTALVHARMKDGETRQEARRFADLLVESFANKGADRESLLGSVAEQARGDGLTASDRAALEASACIAVVGTAFDAGMVDSSELRSYWEVRKKTLLPPPPPRVPGPASNECITADFGIGTRGQPFLLRNRCDYAVVAAFCAIEARAGSPAEEISCESGSYATYDIKPRHAAMVVSDSREVKWFACRPPLTPRVWWDSTRPDPGQGICEEE